MEPKQTTDWTTGGILWSLNRWVKHEVRSQFRENPLAKRARYPWTLRTLRWVFSAATFWNFLKVYLAIDLAMIMIEAGWPILIATNAPAWSHSPAATELIRTVPSYLIGAQVGILGVISLALALVTLIAQRDEASTDVQVYYHESLFFEVAASCLALTAVLCVQLLWPLQFGLHLLGYGAKPELFRLVFVVIHLGWFLANLTAVAHFISVTFRFVQRQARERLRESYTANVVVPKELTERVRENMYLVAGMEAVPTGSDDELHIALFGSDMSEPYTAELSANFRRPVRLSDVRIRPAHWAIHRWARRSRQAAIEAPNNGATTLATQLSPRLWFAPQLGRAMTGEVAWCRRSGGVPLDTRERLALRFAFRFQRVRDGD